MSKQATVMGVSFWMDEQVPSLLHWRSGEQTGQRQVLNERITSIQAHEHYPDILRIRVGHQKYWLKILDPEMKQDYGLLISMSGEVYQTQREKNGEQEGKQEATPKKKKRGKNVNKGKPGRSLLK